MRVTNGMMRTNSMLNMQKNKITYDKYLQQYNTQKKIQRPSDDPTIAVRALKYRTTLNEIEQYQRNIDDASSWMDATETAIRDVDKVMDNMVEYVTQAATGTVNAKDRADINKQLDQYAHYIYEQDMNADYAGRYLFTGYRTDSALLFSEAQENVIYTIHEPLEIKNINPYSYVYGEAEYETETVYGGNLSVYPPNSATAPVKQSVSASTYAAEAPEFRTANRILLSYSDLCDNTADVYEELENSIDNRLIYMTPTIVFKDRNGNECSLEVTVKSVASDQEPGVKYNEHLNAQKGTGSTLVRVRDSEGYIIDEKAYGDVFFVPETGELVFADDIYDEIRGGSDLMITYQKREFDKNDIRPEHYFTCETLDIGTTEDAVYNTEQYYITAADKLKEAIGYEDMTLADAKSVSEAMKAISKLDPNSPTYATDLEAIVNSGISPAMQTEMVTQAQNYMKAYLSTNLFYDAIKDQVADNVRYDIYTELKNPTTANKIRQNIEAEYYATDDTGKYILDTSGKHTYKKQIQNPDGSWRTATEADFNVAVLDAFKEEYEKRVTEAMKNLPATVRTKAEEFAEQAVNKLYDSDRTVAENLAKMDIFVENYATELNNIEHDVDDLGNKLNLYGYTDINWVQDDPTHGHYESNHIQCTDVNDYLSYVERDAQREFENPYSTRPGASGPDYYAFFYNETTGNLKDGYSSDDYDDAKGGYVALKSEAWYPLDKIITNVINESDNYIKRNNYAVLQSNTDKISYYEDNGITQDNIDDLVNKLVNENEGDNYDLVKRYSLEPTKVLTTGASRYTGNLGDVGAITEQLMKPGGIIEEYTNNLKTDKTQTMQALPWDEYSRYKFRDQNIQYQINFSQLVTVNTEGRNAVGTEVGRGIEDIKTACNELDVIEAKMSEVTKRIADLDEGRDAEEIANLTELKTKLQSQMDLQKTVLVKSLGSMITTIQGAKEKINVALADHGSRYNRMVMTRNKIDELEIDTNQAKSDNEDADIGEAYINFTEANLLYQATLNATSKVLKQSLLDFI